MTPATIQGTPRGSRLGRSHAHSGNHLLSVALKFDSKHTVTNIPSASDALCNFIPGTQRLAKIVKCAWCSDCEFCRLQAIRV